MGNIRYKGGNYTKDSRSSYVQVEPLSVTENGTYTAESGKAYNPVSVDVSTEQNVVFADISDTSFTMSNNVVKVNIPKNIVSIGNSSFINYVNLAEVKLDEGLETIGTTAFQNCGFENIEIPSTVKNIGSGAFQSCQNLLELNFLPAQPPTLGGNILTSNSTYYYRLFVPDNSVEAYKTANYFSFWAHRISPVSQKGVTLNEEFDFTRENPTVGKINGYEMTSENVTFNENGANFGGANANLFFPAELTVFNSSSWDYIEIEIDITKITNITRHFLIGYYSSYYTTVQYYPSGSTAGWCLGTSSEYFPKVAKPISYFDNCKMKYIFKKRQERRADISLYRDNELVYSWALCDVKTPITNLTNMRIGGGNNNLNAIIKGLKFTAGKF